MEQGVGDGLEQPRGYVTGTGIVSFTRNQRKAYPKLLCSSSDGRERRRAALWVGAAGGSGSRRRCNVMSKEKLTSEGK
ncbi:hypothetical protein ACS0TY_034457 [Phlomoides rotata]